MADQIPKIKLKRQVLQLKPPHLCLQTLMVGLCVLAASICSVKAATCPSSVPPSAATTTEQCSFTGYPDTYTEGLAVGPVSNSLYYLYWIYSLSRPSMNAAVRKVDASGSQTWIASFAAFWPMVKSLSVDAAEQSVYLASWEKLLVVLKLAASDGSIVSQHQFSGINGGSYDLKTWPLVDLSGYFVSGCDSSSFIAKICKYTFSSSTAQCQTITNINFGFGHLMISNSQFFVLGDASSSPYNLQMYKLTFSLTSVNWAKQIACLSGTCEAYNSESVLSSDGSTVYSFFTFRAITYHLHFCGLYVSDGSVATTRYKSSSHVFHVFGSALNGDYLVATTYSPTSLVMYNISSSAFTIKSFSSSDILYGCGVEPSSGRFVVNGRMGNNGYTTKFVPQSISLNSDFSSATWTMTALSAGTDDIVAISGVTISSPGAVATTVGPYSNQTVTYNLISSTNVNAYLQTDTQDFSVTESTTSMQTPNMSCSFSGSTSITFSLSILNGAIFPSFVSIDSATGVLLIAAPSVSNPTTYSFYITSTISGMSRPVQKIINLTINKSTASSNQNCTVNNCQICSTADSTVCMSCNSGYNINSGSCILSKSEAETSETAKSLSTSSQAVIGAIALFSIGSSLTNLSSMASLWSVINQMQIFFLLFLTGAFIPKDIESIIAGLKICLNPFSYFQSNSGGNSNFVSNFFDFGLENSNLEKLGIKSDSTIVNVYSFILSMMIICVLHLCIKLIQKLLKKESQSDGCTKCLTFVHFVLKKLMVLFTFALYIRIILKTNQFILTSCISEIYHFNYDGSKRKASIVIAFLTLIACIILIIATIVLAVSKSAFSNSESPEKRSKFAQLFNGVSLNRKSRLYTPLLQLRRAIFVTLLITVEPVSSILVISLLVGLEVVYLGLLIFIRPFELVKCNIIEIINEMYFLTMLATLLKYNTVAGWEGLPTTVYTWFMTSNCFVSLSIISIDLIKKLIVKCKNKCCYKNTEPAQDNNVQSIVASRISNTMNYLEPSNMRINNSNLTLNIQFDRMERAQSRQQSLRQKIDKS